MLHNLHMFSTKCRALHVLSCLVHKMFTFYIKDVLKFECPNLSPNSSSKAYVNL